MISEKRGYNSGHKLPVQKCFPSKTKACIHCIIQLKVTEVMQRKVLSVIHKLLLTRCILFILRLEKNRNPFLRQKTQNNSYFYLTPCRMANAFSMRPLSLYLSLPLCTCSVNPLNSNYAKLCSGLPTLQQSMLV